MPFEVGETVVIVAIGAIPGFAAKQPSSDLLMFVVAVFEHAVV